MANPAILQQNSMNWPIWFSKMANLAILQQNSLKWPIWFSKMANLAILPQNSLKWPIWFSKMANLTLRAKLGRILGPKAQFELGAFGAKTERPYSGPKSSI